LILKIWNKHLKLHQNIITNIEQTLHKIFVEHRLSDKEVPKVLKNKIFGSRDRSLIASCIYDIVSNDNTIGIDIKTTQATTKKAFINGLKKELVKIKMF